MADTMKLKSNGTEVTFAPLPGFIFPADYTRSVHKAMDGTLYIYQWATKNQWEIPLNNISQATAAYMNQWWQSMDSLTFYYDLINYPTTTVTVKIVNDTQPMQMMFPSWRTIYEGTLILREE